MECLLVFFSVSSHLAISSYGHIRSIVYSIANLPIFVFFFIRMRMRMRTLVVIMICDMCSSFRFFFSHDPSYSISLGVRPFVLKFGNMCRVGCRGNLVSISKLRGSIHSHVTLNFSCGS
ncbi:hypothetical protein DFH27DRAFT_63682 [Peziza echinospora]|nr:hypothetical protein DFH27DRAFT_63682 [Peziza echinospora]